MEKVSGQNLATFFNQWLYKPENLKISAHWEFDATAKQVVLKINQTHSSGFIFDFPIEVEIFNADTNSSDLLKFQVNSKETIIPIKLNKIPSSIKLDPRTVLLAEIEMK